ncbi:MAG: putative porin, partial [Candidatus Omnitrophota bacterium]|nr:putative porin [Candidatus Omnitrophota bacterium]
EVKMRFVRSCFALILTMGIIFTSIPNLYADETSEVILRLLVKKGIISQSEVDEIKREVARKEPIVPQGIEDRVAKLEKNTPKWVKDFKLKGDLRLRHETEINDPGKDNSHQRMRFRLGVTTKVNDQIDLGFGLATGGTTGSSAATSTNQTMDGSFGTKSFDLDYAYAKYKPYKGLYLIGGKFKSPFFHTDMLWDGDIRFEGFAAEASNKLDFAPSTKVALRGGYFPMEDVSSSARDPHLLIAQIGSETKFNDDLKLKTGVAYYDFRSIEGSTTATLTNTKGTNTYDGTVLRNDYRIVSPTIKVSVSKVGGVLGEFAKNTGAPEGNEAWRAGAWFGKAKVKKKGQWKLLGQYTHLEKDATVDIFPDGDLNDAGTNAEGWEVIFDYGLADNLILSFDYYNTTVIEGTQSDDQMIQADLIFKF